MVEIDITVCLMNKCKSIKNIKKNIKNNIEKKEKGHKVILIKMQF